MTSSAADIGEESAFKSGRPYPIEVKGKRILVVRKDGEFYALRDACPHAGAPLSKGAVSGAPLACKPGEEVPYGREGEILTCPWHGWTFDLQTGQSLSRPEKIRVRSYPVTVENGRVWVDLGPA